MDWIVVLLIIIGVVSRSNKKKKQARQKSEQAWQAAEAMAQGEARKGRIPPKMRQEITDFVKDLGEDVIDNGIPTVREAVREIRDALPKKPAAQAVNMPRQAAPRPAETPSGSLNYQPAAYAPMQAQRLEAAQLEGESHAEHAGHVARIRAEEQAFAAESARGEILRGMNLNKLRAAVVMSEVLGKPVALRHRYR